MENDPSKNEEGDHTAIAQLMFHCGVGVRMNYGDSTSGAYTSYPTSYL